MVSRSSLNLLTLVNVTKMMGISGSAVYGNGMKLLQCLRMVSVGQGNLSTHFPSRFQQTCHNPLFTFRVWKVWNWSCATSLKHSSYLSVINFWTTGMVRVRSGQENAFMFRLCAQLWTTLVLTSIYHLLRVWVLQEILKPTCRWQCLRTFTLPVRWPTWRSTLITHRVPILAA